MRGLLRISESGELARFARTCQKSLGNVWKECFQLPKLANYFGGRPPKFHISVHTCLKLGFPKKTGVPFLKSEKHHI